MTYRHSAAFAALATVLLAAPAYADHHMEKGAENMSKEDVFMKIDADSDSKLTFTEFSNFSDEYGVDTSDAVQEFSRLAGETTTIDMDGFDDFDMTMLKGHKMKMKKSGDKMMDSGSMAMSSSNVGTMRVEYGDFTKLDADSDGQVSFKEYSKMRKSQGVTSMTQTAQEFTRLTNGQAMLSADQYQMAMSNDVLNQPKYRSNQASSTSMNDGVKKDMMKETKSKSKDKIKSPKNNNPAGLNQMNSPDQESNMTNSGVDSDLDKTSNPQMKVWGDK